MKNVSKKLSKEECCKPNWRPTGCGCGGGAYFLGVIGSAVFFIQNSTGFWPGVLGFLKALVWPAFVVYGLLKYLGL